MTAEVAILNKLAVSLAADSAVTTGLPGREKIFTSANKIFTLSKYAPIGVMVYGHVEHGSVPWETIIKEFRRELDTKRYGRIIDYVAEFEKFFSREKFVIDSQCDQTILIACLSALGELHKRMKTSQRSWTSGNINKSLEEMTSFAEKWEYLGHLAALSYRQFTTKYNHVLDAFLDDNDYFHAHLPKASRTAFKAAVLLSMKIKMPSAFMSGIVIAGFGEEEMFPTLKEIKVDGSLLGQVRKWDGPFVDISRSKETVWVKAFAQDDVVNSFIEGYDGELQNYIGDMLSSFIEDHTKTILDAHTSYGEQEKITIMDMVRKSIPESIHQFQDELLDFCQNRYSEPVADVLRSAPKDELAHVAESLVSLTSLKRRVSGDRETVGGPVDVAVISKGDGFVWIKRKHYFAAELNHHFARNYFGEGEGNGQRAEN